MKIPDITIFIIIIILVLFYFSPAIAIISIIIALGILINYFIQKRAKAKEEMLFKERVRQDQEKKKQLVEEEKIRREQNLRRQFIESEKRRQEFLKKKQAEFKAAVDSIPLFEIILSDEKHNRNQEFNIIDKEYKNITKATPINKIKDFVALDVETTGLKTGGNDIIQLSAVKYKNFKAIEAFNTYIKPRKNIPKEASEINGITDDMVENAPRFYQIINSFNSFIEDLPIVAHNAPFDIKHLYVNGLDSVDNKIVYDTLVLSRRTYKDEYSYKLADICESNNIYICHAHNSLYDSYAAGELFKTIVADKKEIDLDNLFTTE